jgi:hypothetical protein
MDNSWDESGILEIGKIDGIKAAYTMLEKLRNAEERAENEGWIDAEELEKELG